MRACKTAQTAPPGPYSSCPVPIFVELLLQLLVGNIDQFMVSRVSQEAVAAIGNGNQVMNLTIIVINVLCMASSILVSREIGAKDGRSLAQICTVSVAFIGAVSLAVTLMLVFGSGLFFRLLRVPEDILGQANDYLMIVGAFALVQGLYMVFAAVLRAYGFVREVMLTAVIMNALNIAGNAVLIGGLFGLPRLGIVGAAISTDISKTVGLLLLFAFQKKDRRSDAPFAPASLSAAAARAAGGHRPADGRAGAFLQPFTDGDFELHQSAGAAGRRHEGLLFHAGERAYVYSMAIAAGDADRHRLHGGRGPHRADRAAHLFHPSASQPQFRCR